MSEPPPFREEAIAHHRRQRGPGSVLRIGPRWTRWAFWTLAVLAAAALVTAGLVRVDRETFVPATVEGTTVRAVVDRELALRQRPGDRARFVPAGAGRRAVAVRVLSVGRTDLGEVPPGTLLVTARAERPVTVRGGVLRLRGGTRSLLRDLIPGLQS